MSVDARRYTGTRHAEVMFAVLLCGELIGMVLDSRETEPFGCYRLYRSNPPPHGEEIPEA